MSIKKLSISALSLALLFLIAMFINGMSIFYSLVDTVFFIAIFAVISSLKKGK